MICELCGGEIDGAESITSDHLLAHPECRRDRSELGASYTTMALLAKASARAGANLRANYRRVILGRSEHAAAMEDLPELLSIVEELLDRGAGLESRIAELEQIIEMRGGDWRRRS